MTARSDDEERISAAGRDLINRFLGNLELLHDGDSSRMLVDAGTAVVALVQAMNKNDPHKSANALQMWAGRVAELMRDKVVPPETIH